MKRLCNSILLLAVLLGLTACGNNSQTGQTDADSSADLNYNKSDSRANKEQNDSSARPAMSGKVEDMDKYNIVVLAYPNCTETGNGIFY